MPGLRLLVEGKNDEHVFRNLLAHHGIASVEVKEKGGADNLLAALEQELKASDFDRLGVVLDADTTLRSRWESLRFRLRRAGYQTTPEELPESGLVVRASGFRPVGVWFVPDNRVDGKLEDLVQAMVPPGDLLWPYAVRTLDEIPEKRFKSADQSKALIHTWLAWQPEPGYPMGAAITRQYLDPAAPVAAKFVQWVKELSAAEMYWDPIE